VKSDLGPTRQSGELLLEGLDKRLSLGKYEESVEEDCLDRRLYLTQ